MKLQEQRLEKLTQAIFWGEKPVCGFRVKRGSKYFLSVMETYVSNFFARSQNIEAWNCCKQLFCLHVDKDQSFYKLALLFLMEMVRHVQSTQNRKLVIFLQYLKKKVSQLLLCSIIMMQNIQIFYHNLFHVDVSYFT